MMSCAITNPPPLLLIHCAECSEVGLRRDSSSASLHFTEEKFQSGICRHARCGKACIGRRSELFACWDCAAGREQAGSHQTPSSACGGFEYFLLNFALIWTRKWLIVFSGLRVR